MTARPTAVRRHQQSTSQPHSRFRGLWTRSIRVRVTASSLGRWPAGSGTPRPEVAAEACTGRCVGSSRRGGLVFLRQRAAGRSPAGFGWGGSASWRSETSAVFSAGLGEIGFADLCGVATVRGPRGALAVSADGPDASAAEQRHRGDDHPRVAQPTSDDTEGTGCNQHRPGTANHRDQGKPGSEGSPDGPESSGRPGDSCPSLFVSSILLGMRRWTARRAGGGQQQCLFARASIVGATPESTWSSMVAARSFASR